MTRYIQKRTIGLCFLIVCLCSTLGANPKFFSSIQEICSAYQVPVNSSDISLAQRPDGKQELTILINCSRNNFDRAMLIGFFAVGKALKYYDVMVDCITLVIKTEYKESVNIYATADRGQIQAYVDGQLNSTEFIRKLKFS